MENMMQCLPTHRYFVCAVAAGVVAMTALAGCAQHVYLSGAPSPDPAAFQRYSDDWFAAARVGRTDILQALNEAHYPLEMKTPEGYTALILSAYDGHPDSLKMLIDAGADPCAYDRHGNTALMGALFKGDERIAATLIDTHCAIDQTNNAGETALSFAALFGRLDVLPVLVARRRPESRRCPRRNGVANRHPATQPCRGRCIAPCRRDAVRARRLTSKGSV
jgi:hypothetical protein